VIGRAGGSVVSLDTRTIVAALTGARAGDGARIATGHGASIPARIVAVERGRAVLAPLDDADGVRPGDRVALDPGALTAIVGLGLLGRAVAADGAPLDGGAPARGTRVPLAGRSVPPGERTAIAEPFWTGVRAIDGPLAFGRGARIGLFGPAGAGKSTLLETIVAGGAADATVVALIGERGREAERWLRSAGRRTTVVCATADRSAAERMRAAELAFAQAAALRDRGLHVLLVLDSLARVAAAARDVALAAGEPAGRGGYPASVVGRQARLLERAGATGAGSVTLIATVLVEGPLDGDPIADAARAALDGHLVLDPALAGAGRFPAIALGASASRTMADVAAPAHRRAAARLRAAVAALDASRDARALGLDPAAGDPILARAVAAEPAIAAFLTQEPAPSPAEETLMLLTRIADSLDDGHLR
jgi:type III secretion protein N (ATPase)